MKSSRVECLLGVVVFVIGVLNLLLVHPVPGGVFLLVSLIYTPMATRLLVPRLGSTATRAVRIAVGLAVIWFTLGVSDLGDMLD